MIAHICQLHSSVAPVLVWRFLQQSILLPRELQPGSVPYGTWTVRASQMKEIRYYKLLHGSKETQKVNLSPGTGVDL